MVQFVCLQEFVKWVHKLYEASIQTKQDHSLAPGWKFEHCRLCSYCKYPHFCRFDTCQLQMNTWTVLVACWRCAVGRC